MLDESHVDVAREESEFDCAQFIEGPAFATAACGDRFVPNCRHFFAQGLVFDLHQTRKEFRDFIDSAVGSFGCCHSSHVMIEIPNSKHQHPDEAPSFNIQNK